MRYLYLLHRKHHYPRPRVLKASGIWASDLRDFFVQTWSSKRWSTINCIICTTVERDTYMSAKEAVAFDVDKEIVVVLVHVAQSPLAVVHAAKVRLEVLWPPPMNRRRIFSPTTPIFANAENSDGGAREIAHRQSFQRDASHEPLAERASPATSVLAHGAKRLAALSYLHTRISSKSSARYPPVSPRKPSRRRRMVDDLLANLFDNNYEDWVKRVLERVPLSTPPGDDRRSSGRRRPPGSHDDA